MNRFVAFPFVNLNKHIFISLVSVNPGPLMIKILICIVNGQLDSKKMITYIIDGQDSNH